MKSRKEFPKRIASLELEVKLARKKNDGTAVMVTQRKWKRNLQSGKVEFWLTRLPQVNSESVLAH